MQRSVTTDSFKLDFSLESPQSYLITGLIKPFCAVPITIKRFLQFNPFISSCPFGPPPKTHHPFWRSNTEKDILRGWKPISSSHHRFPWMPNYSLSCTYWTSEDRNITTKNEPLSFSTIDHFVTYKSVSTPGICGLQWVLNAATPCKATRPIQSSIFSLIRRLTSVMPQVSCVVCTKEALAM